MPNGDNKNPSYHSSSYLKNHPETGVPSRQLFIAGPFVPGPLGKHLWASMRREFISLDWKKARTEAMSGSLLAAAGVWIGTYFGLSTKADWDEHPVVLGVIVVLPFLFLFLDISTRVIKALYRVYRERPHPDFREPVHVATAIFVGALFYGSICFYVDYLNSPHFTLTLTKFFVTQNIRASEATLGIATDREEPQPNTVFDFPNVVIKNSGIESEARDWSLIVIVPHAKPVIGVPIMKGGIITDPKNPQAIWWTFGAKETIFARTTKPFLGRTNGVASFLVGGMSNDTARLPGTELTINCHDKNGKVSSVSTVVPATEVSALE